MDEFLESNWESLLDYMKHRWTELSDEDLKEIDKSYDQLVAMIQLHYGYTFERAQQEVQEMANDFAVHSQPMLR